MQMEDESVGPINMPSPLAPTKRVVPQYGSPTRSGLLHPRSYSPSLQRCSPYEVPQSNGATSPGAPTEQSGVICSIQKPYVLTPAKYRARLSKQESAATVPLST